MYFVVYILCVNLLPWIKRQQWDTYFLHVILWIHHQRSTCPAPLIFHNFVHICYLWHLHPLSSHTPVSSIHQIFLIMHTLSNFCHMMKNSCVFMNVSTGQSISPLHCSSSCAYSENQYMWITMNPVVAQTDH